MQNNRVEIPTALKEKQKWLNTNYLSIVHTPTVNKWTTSKWLVQKTENNYKTINEIAVF